MEYPIIGDIPTNEEILDTIRSFKPFKALGPDGLHPFFYQKYWDIVGDSVTELCKNAFIHGHIPTEINNTYICLVPKKPNPSNIRDFHVISLCNTTYKTITKIISQYLRPFMSKLIGPRQTSFLENRQASNNERKKNANMILKLDLEKAFDKIEWPFIKETLRLFNLPHNLIKLIL